MTVLLIGLAICLLDVSVSVSAAQIGLFPDVIGYALILRALAGMPAFHPEKRRMQDLCRWGAFVTFVFYVLALLGASAWWNGWLTAAMDLAAFVLEAWMAFLIVRCMCDADRSVNGVGSKRLPSAWRLSVIFGVISFFSVASPESTLLLFGFSLVADVYLMASLFKRSRDCSFL